MHPCTLKPSRKIRSTPRILILHFFHVPTRFTQCLIPQFLLNPLHDAWPPPHPGTASLTKPMCIDRQMVCSTNACHITQNEEEEEEEGSLTGAMEKAEAAPTMAATTVALSMTTFPPGASSPPLNPRGLTPHHPDLHLFHRSSLLSRSDRTGS
eukprot:758311-Hanusia_phi.AAC.7